MGFNASAGLAAVDRYWNAKQRKSDIAARQARNQYAVDTLPGLADLSIARTGSELDDLSDKEERRPQIRENTRLADLTAGVNAEVGLSAARAGQQRQPVIEQTNDINSELGLAQAKSAQANRPTYDLIEGSKARTGLTVQQGLEQTAPLNNVANIGKATAGATSGQVQALQGIVQAFNTGDSVATGRAVANAHAALTGGDLRSDIGGARMIDVNGQKALAVTDASGQIIADIPPMRASTLRMLQKQMLQGQKSELKSVAPGATLVQMGRDGVPRPVFTAPESQKSAQDRAGSLEKNARFYSAATGVPLDVAVQQLSMGKAKDQSSFLAQAISDKRRSDTLGKWEPSQEWIAQQKQLWSSIQSAGGLSSARPTTGTSNTPASTVPPDLLRKLYNPGR